ncbi:MAG TPA: Mov34/MPN/PAD-1 family protein [Candidatus Dormibacteraeota bacterium]
MSDGTIYTHVFASADREVGGVLIGRMPADGGLPLVTGAIPAISADEQKATLTFTQEAWAHVHQVLESEFPADEQIVGWYHSHPSFGIFLSGHDLFIHENFFNAPSQIAVVVDPIGCREGAFGWQDGKLEALYERATPKRWRVPPEVLASLQPRHVEEERVVVAPEPAITLSTRIVAVVVIVTCVLAVVALLLLIGVIGGSSGPRVARPAPTRVEKPHKSSGET